MLYVNTLYEIMNNINTGVEYEIALFYKLLRNKPAEQAQVMNSINTRNDAAKIKSIIDITDTTVIEQTLQNRGLTLINSSFETQNDEVGPADIVMYVKDGQGKAKRIGLSVKYANTCTLNVTGRNFITETQIARLKSLLPHYTALYIEEMINNYGNVSNWFRMRKPSSTTDKFIDLIRDAVIENWSNVKNKTTLLSAMFHSNSPIEFWVVTYNNRGYKLKTKPQTIDMNRANEVRSVLSQLGRIAEKYKCAIILVGHLNKMQGTKANYRGLGSVDFQATARSVLVVGRVKDSPETRVMAHQKSSLAPEGEPIAFELNKETGFHWIGHYDISIDDLLSGFSRQKKSEMAESLITDCLAEGKCPQQVIQQKAESMGISKRILDTVKKSLDVQSIKIGSKWYWQLAA